MSQPALAKVTNAGGKYPENYSKRFVVLSLPALHSFSDGGGGSTGRGIASTLQGKKLAQRPLLPSALALAQRALAAALSLARAAALKRFLGARAGACLLYTSPSPRD